MDHSCVRRVTHMVDCTNYLQTTPTGNSTNSAFFASSETYSGGDVRRLVVPFDVIKSCPLLVVR